MCIINTDYVHVYNKQGHPLTVSARTGSCSPSGKRPTGERRRRRQEAAGWAWAPPPPGQGTGPSPHPGGCVHLREGAGEGEAEGERESFCPKQRLSSSDRTASGEPWKQREGSASLDGRYSSSQKRAWLLFDLRA